MAATGMTVAMGAQAANSIGSSIAQADAMRAQGDYQKRMAYMNADMDELQAKESLRRGEAAASDAKKQGKAVKGAQRAALAAQGIDVNSGSAADVQDETQMISESNQLKLKSDAWREAWGFKTNAAMTRNNANFMASASRRNANMTLLTGGMQALSYGAQAYHYQYGGDTKKATQDKKD